MEDPAPVTEFTTEVALKDETIKPEPSKLLRDDAGSELTIFCEPTGNHRYPKFCRQVKKYGGSIATTIEGSKIVLVDPETNSGRQTIRDWSTEDRIILDYTWLDKCKQAGKALLEGDGWGGCIVVDDGKALGGDDLPSDSDHYRDIAALEPTLSGQIEIPSLDLPTPRQTPPSASPAMPTETHSVSPSVRGRQTGVPSRGRPVSSASSHRVPSRKSSEVCDRDQTPKTSSSRLSSVNPVPTPVPSLIPSSCTTVCQPIASASAIPVTPPTIAPGPNSLMGQAQFNPMPLMPPNPMQLILDQQNQLYGNPYMNVMNPMQYWQLQMQQMQQMNPQMMQQMNPQMMQQMNPQMMQPSTMHLQLMYGGGPMTGMMNGLPGMNDMQVQSFQPDPPSGAVPLDDTNEQPVSVKLPKTKRKDKGKDKSKAEDRAGSRTSSSALKKESAPPAVKKSGSVFEPNGNQLSFFLEIGMFQRNDAVSLIKKNGGAVLSEAQKADYVLLKAGSKDSQHYLDQAMPGVPVVSVRFLRECVANGKLLDHQKYLPDGCIFTAKASLTAKAASSSVKAKAKPKAELKSTVKAECKPKATQSTDGTETPTQRKRDRAEYTPSPSPPPPHNIVDRAGKYRYTEEEKDYARRYSAILFKREPYISARNLATLMHEKIKIHPVRSWLSFVAKEFNDGTFTFLQKRGAKEYSKRQEARAKADEEARNHASSSSVTKDDVVPGPPPKKRKLSVPPPSQDDAALVAQDIETAVDFFVSGADLLDDDPDEIWTLLAHKTPCRSMATWQDFYMKHHETIVAKYSQLAED